MKGGGWLQRKRTRGAVVALVIATAGVVFAVMLRISTVQDRAAPQEGVGVDGDIELVTGIADMVAEVRVVDVLDTRYNTEDGLRPTQQAGGDIGEFDRKDMFYTPIQLEVLQILKTTSPAADGLVVHQVGGVHEGRVDFQRLWINPVDWDSQPTGIVFAKHYEFTLDPTQTPPAWPMMDVLLAEVDRLSTGGATYYLAGVEDFYQFDGDRAYSMTMDESLSKADLLAQIQAALPTPTP